VLFVLEKSMELWGPISGGKLVSFTAERE
jgi:hypothetical protein